MSTVVKFFGFEPYPKFRLNEPRFPQDTFLGRYFHFLDIIDPRTLFISNEELNSSIKLLNDYKEGKGSAKISDKELWKAQKIKNAIVHPDTNKKIFPAFRMSGYVPFGWITVTGMLLPNPSWSTILFWQWMNQSHNALVNYSNRNATQDQSKFIKAYCIAVSSACSTATGLTYLIKKCKNISINKQIFLQRFVALPATSLASSLNILSMRWSEIFSGIEIYDSEKNVIGISKVAAKKAVFETTLTRAFLPVPLLILPPCIMPFFERMEFVKKCWRRHLVINAIVCTLSFAFSLPISLALFPQQSKIETIKLETELQKLTNEPILYYNRGL
ncbi:unnamed protein product [Dracunculus medinensis]|uniref:Sidoreflexin n=1 Tax=Dracunculus medinensis TaxID=318479 RepID=A0A0N4UQU1_DRAME|nr:unnamed protein product [Dracunculus medinensis]